MLEVQNSKSLIEVMKDFMDVYHRDYFKVQVLLLEKEFYDYKLLLII